MLTHMSPVTALGAAASRDRQLAVTPSHAGLRASVFSSAVTVPATAGTGVVLPGSAQRGIGLAGARKPAFELAGLEVLGWQGLGSQGPGSQGLGLQGPGFAGETGKRAGHLLAVMACPQQSIGDDDDNNISDKTRMYPVNGRELGPQPPGEPEPV